MVEGVVATPVDLALAWRLRPSSVQIRLTEPIRASAVHRKVLPDLTSGGPETVIVPEREATVSFFRSAVPAGDTVVRGGEPVAIEVAGVGFLSADPPSGAGAAAVIRTGTDPVDEWVITGVPPGVELPVDRPVGLFNRRCGDHLLGEPTPDGIRLGWVSQAWPGPGIPLPVPEELRPPEGVPPEAEIAGTGIPVGTDSRNAGLLILLDLPRTRALAEMVRRQRPGIADRLAAEGHFGTIACRWPDLQNVPGGEPDLPEPGAQVWVQAPLVADPGPCADPVRVLAWAETASGDPVCVGPADPDWPDLTVTWWIRVLRPAPEWSAGTTGSRVPAAFYLPLPARDEDPDSTTTFTPVQRCGPGSIPDPGPRGSPSLVRDPRYGRRALRFGLRDLPTTRTWGWSVRIHLPADGGDPGHRCTPRAARYASACD